MIKSKLNKIDLIILAGGRGSRISKLTKKKPKPLIKFKNKHFISYLINHYSKYPFQKIFILAGYKGQQIFKKFNKKISNGIEIECIVEKTVTVSSTKTAEMTKLLENIHRAVNIGLVNELKMVADKMDIDIFEVIKTAATKPFGFTPFYPGPGLGGHCIPIDPFYLTWKAKQVGVTTRFIELAGEVNTNMPQWVLEKAEIGLLNRGLKISESKVLILGMAYKKNVDDLRESPSLELIRLLSERGVDADYHDFYIHKLHHTRKYSFDKSSINLKESIGNYDLVILSTDHDQYDYEYLQNNSKLIVDTRGRFKGNFLNIISA